MRSYTISELAREFDVTPRALRFYEDKDLLHPKREGMNRVYSHRDRGRLQLILQGKRVGLTLAEIREILDLYTLEGHGAQLEHSHRKFQAQIAKLERQKDDIEGALAQLREGVGWMEDQLAKLERKGQDAKVTARAFDEVARKFVDPDIPG